MAVLDLQPTVEGIDLGWSTSEEKIRFDVQFRRAVSAPLWLIEKFGAYELSKDLGKDNGLYEEHRLEGDGSLTVVKKSQSMTEGIAAEHKEHTIWTEEEELQKEKERWIRWFNGDQNAFSEDEVQVHPTGPLTDQQLNFSKDNPRIPSARANAIRDLAFDEAWQARNLIPMWSWVGPRAYNIAFDRRVMSVLWRADRGFARDYNAHIRLNPLLRKGMTSPGSLHGKTTSDRSAQTILEMTHLDYDHFVENATYFNELSVISQTPLAMGRAGVRGYLNYQPQGELTPQEQLAA